jgi:transcription initiation factor TFIIIB Brf1 subunit/transcription initiation factor TFIIB
MFLACKVLEQPRHLAPLCKELHSLHMKKKIQATPTLLVPPLSTANLSKLKEDILLNEFFLLDEIGFNVTVKLPYKRIAKFVGNLSLDAGAKNNFLRLAYRYANDFFRTSAPLVKSHYNLAEACIFLASTSLKIELNLKPDRETIRILNSAVKIECIH